MLGRLAAMLLLAFSLSFALTLVSPSVQDLKDGDTIDLGTMGPGQTVYIQIDPLIKQGGVHGIGGQFDEAVAVDLPRGWTSESSKLYQNPLQVTISADPEAPEGNYTVKVTAIDENNGELLGNVSFLVKVRITWDVMDFDVTPSYLTVGPGQPARFKIKITNKASTSDVFQVSTVGAKRWEFVKPVFVPAQSAKTIYYEIVGEEEETYRSSVKVVSLASKNIADEKNVTLFVASNLLGDYRATNNGVAVFPIFEAPVYSLAGLIATVVDAVEGAFFGAS
ncbi:MAG: hypothetical protein V1827_06045 [Candidatus Micrarchaeota archaeon]